MAEEYEYIKRIHENLNEHELYLVMVFGVYAFGKPGKNSVIDLLVVTNDNFMPKTNEELSQIYSHIENQLESINREVPINLIVQTKPMYQQVVGQNNSFAYGIPSQGRIIYDRSKPKRNGI